MLVSALQIPRGFEIIIIVLVIVVLIFGAKKIPELARAVGRSAGEFRKGQTEGQREESDEKARERLSEDERVRKAAMELGIPTEGKTIEEIKDSIRRATSR